MGSSSRRTSAGRDELLRQPQPPALAAAQSAERPGARLVGVEAEAVEHGVDASGEGVAALAVEALEVAVVAGQHLRACSGRPPRPGPSPCSRQRALEREQLGEARRRPPPRPCRRRAKSRCCSISEKRSPRAARDGARGRLGLAGDEPEQRRLAGAVPADDAPASRPRATVKVTSRQQPGGAELDRRRRRWRAGSPAGPLAPGGLGVADGELLLLPHQRDRAAASAPRPACSSQRSSLSRAAPSPRSAKRRELAVHQRLHAELLGEPAELARRGGALLQVHEVGLDPPLGEEAERFPRLGTLPDAEDLDFHGAGIYTSRASPTRRRPGPSWTTFWPNHTLPSALAVGGQRAERLDAPGDGDLVGGGQHAAIAGLHDPETEGADPEPAERILSDTAHPRRSRGWAGTGSSAAARASAG